MFPFSCSTFREHLRSENANVSIRSGSAYDHAAANVATFLYKNPSGLQYKQHPAADQGHGD
jgi:hypothetical protein